MKQQESSLLIDLVGAPAPSQAERQALAASQAQAAARASDGGALLVISAEVRQAILPDIAAGRYPRRDYFELARALQADILDWTAIDARARLLARVAGKSVAHAWLAFRQRRAYPVIYTDSERVGIPLALLLKLTRARNRHIMLAHLLSPWKKRIWFRLGRIESHIATIICHSSLQRQFMIEKLHIPAEKIRLIPYQVDERFWRPMTPQEARAAMNEAAASTTADGRRAGSPASEAASAPTTPIICSVGKEFRDYPTLIEAVRGLDVRLEIPKGGYSSVSAHNGRATWQELPPNVHLNTYEYLSLRHLYAASRFVVVPLLDVPNQAGITTILEAMAMGKAVIVSGTRGQTDTVRDRRNNGFGRIEREVLPGFLDAPDVDEELRHLATGFYVRPGDAAELRKAISYLLDHPDIADELGRSGRRVFTALMTLDAFTARVARIVQASYEPSGSPGPAQAAGASGVRGNHIIEERIHEGGKPDE